MPSQIEQPKNSPAQRPIAAAIREAAERLAQICDTARLDAEILAAHAAGVQRLEILANADRIIEPEGYSGLVARRMSGEPVAYIIGHQPFWSLDFKVSPDVLIPRSDSETLISAAVNWFAGRPAPSKILDLGTGSGCLLLAALAEFPQAQGTGIDASNSALAVAKENARANGLADRSEFLQLSWTSHDWQSRLGNAFDLVLANPPYIATGTPLSPMVADHEPSQALFAGPDGLDDYRIIIPALPRLLADEGVAMVEIGFDQSEAVRLLAQGEGLTAIVHHDLAGHARCLQLSK